MRGKPAVPCCVAFAIGVAVSRYLLQDCVSAQTAWAALGCCLVAVGIAALLVRRVEVTGALLVFSMMVAGALRYLLAAGVTDDPKHIIHFTGLPFPVRLRGMVASAPDQREGRVLVTLQASTLVVLGGEVPAHGKVLLSVQGGPSPLRYGDSLEVEGTLRLPRNRRNPGEFDYREYLRARGVHAVLACRDAKNIRYLSGGHGAWLLRKVVYPVREHMTSVVDRSLAGDEAAFLKGLLVGERGEIRPEVRQAFANTGVVHVLAVSGLHVGYVVLIAASICGVLRLPAGGRLLAICAVLALYVLVTEARPPVVRASIMAVLLLSGTAFRRVGNVWNSLAVAGLVVLLINPFELFQAGCQLSFAAVGSILGLYRWLQRAFRGLLLSAVEKDSFWGTSVLPLFFVSLAAQLGTLPLTAYYFGRVPLLSIVANLLVVPTVGVIVPLGYTTALLAPLCWPLAKFYAATNWLLLRCLIHGVEWVGSLPFAYVAYPRPRLMHAVAYYGLLVCFLHVREARWRARTLIFVLALACLAVWADAWRPRGRLEVTLLDVGQGDAVFLRFPNGKCLLVDAGPADSTYDAGRQVVEPFLRHEGVRRLDGIVVTHPHSDHYGGVAHLLRQFPVGLLFEPGQEQQEPLYQELLRVADSVGVRRQIIRAGDELTGWEPAQIFVLHPSEAFVRNSGPAPFGLNNCSLVLLVTFGKTRLLLTGDAETPAEEAMLRFGPLLRSQVLKVAHHGSGGASGERFLAAVAPELALISVGARNPHHHPSPATLARIKKQGAHIWRTDHYAAAVLRSDAQHWELVRWRRKLPPLPELLAW
ncbi:MAG: DNA internalization-related competence protein ComEC/Rec2 [Calditrichaeota bacterium]|nr:DNA internalization-related competence protein ComEC/Rec2 [Calditrichota bacterium]